MYSISYFPIKHFLHNKIKLLFCCILKLIEFNKIVGQIPKILPSYVALKIHRKNLFFKLIVGTVETYESLHKSLVRNFSNLNSILKGMITSVN